MKKRFWILLVICLLITPVTVAYANPILVPDNDFLIEHWDYDIMYSGREYSTNGASGTVSVKKEPGSNIWIGILENGISMYINYVYDYNGTIWGLVNYPYDNDGNPDTPYKTITGWVPLDELLVIYDYISFAEEHEHEIYPYTGGYELAQSGDDTVLWTWPNSGVNKGTLHWNSLEEYEQENFRIISAYTDEQGREWGFCYGQIYVDENVWICLGDPTSTTLSTSATSIPASTSNDAPTSTENPSTGTWQPPEPADSLRKNGLSTTTVSVLFVAVLAVGAMVLIRVCWKPDKGDL